jgi:hypothetical protein
MSIILATWEAEIKRIGVPGQLKKIVHETPISKIARAKWTGGVYEALSSNLSHTHTHTHTQKVTFLITHRRHGRPYPYHFDKSLSIISDR